MLVYSRRGRDNQEVRREGITEDAKIRLFPENSSQGFGAET